MNDERAGWRAHLKRRARVFKENQKRLQALDKRERGQQILRQCTREVEQSLAKFGLGLRKIKKYKVTSSRVGPPNKVKGSKQG